MDHSEVLGCRKGPLRNPADYSGPTGKEVRDISPKMRNLGWKSRLRETAMPSLEAMPSYGTVCDKEGNEKSLKSRRKWLGKALQ